VSQAPPTLHTTSRVYLYASIYLKNKTKVDPHSLIMVTLINTLLMGGSPRIYTAHQKQVPVLKINKINTIFLFSI